YRPYIGIPPYFASDFSSDEDEEYLPTSESSDSDSIIYTTENVADRAEIVSSSASEDPQDESSIHLGRKRRMNAAKWKRNVRKLRCNSGKAYINQKGLKTSAKTFIHNYDCGCKKNVTTR
ncbi:uncharacterized protein LOC131804725, partial [Musca domestica]|uniref:Uncharacterized protein LOC131804725 n=1 Tax=Musca domestica TaxID=7370 RepID=A0ABM3VDF1_MUSDO